VADSQIGASGKFRAYIAEYQIRKTYPGFSDDNIETLVDAYVHDTLTDTYTGYTELEEAIDLLYDTFYDDNTCELENLALLDPYLAAEIFSLQIAAAAADSKGWAETVSIMTEKFPEAAFILSGGDQVELRNRECEYTGFFSPPELTSLPVAPAIGGHERYVNFDHHFNLPNESSEYGVNEAGGDYYFTYGNVLFMVLNMDTTMSTYPEDPPPPPDECEAIDSEEEFKLLLSELENYCDEETKEYYDSLESFKKSVLEHKTFMQETIAANPHAKWKIVMWHYSIYSAGNHATDDVIRVLRYYIVPVLDDLNIDLVLLAHDHSFTRSYQMLHDNPQGGQKMNKRGEIINPTGTLYLTGTSSSGSKYYPLNCNYDVGDDPDTIEVERPNPYFEYVAAASQLEVPLFSYISVDRNSLKICTYRRDTLEMMDIYTIIKQE
jgi:hypothetical protein